MKQPLRPQTENELFKFMYERHDVLLTSFEIDEIVEKIRDEEYSLEMLMRKKIVKYRVINVVILLILGIIGYPFGIKMVLAAFIVYNIAHGAYTIGIYQKWYRNRKNK